MAEKEPKLEFKSKKELRSAKEDFQNLLNHPAWQRIIKYYDEKIKYFEKILNGDIKKDDETEYIQSMNDLQRYRDRRNMALQFRNLPEILIGIEEFNETKEPDFDPFE